MKADSLRIVLNKQDNKLISYKEGSYEDCKKIVGTLTKKEFYYLGGRFINSPHTCYRLVAYYNNTLPIGFIEGYDFTKSDHTITIVVALDKNFRGRDIAQTLIKKLVLDALSHKIKTKDKLYAVIGTVYRENIASIKCIEKTGLFIRNELNDRTNSEQILYLKYATNHGHGPKYKMPYDLNKYLNDFRWGLVYDHKFIDNPSEEDWDKHYKTLSLQEFEKLKAGCCWDYVNFEAEYFRNNYIFKPICYYAEDTNYQTHTWLCFWDNDILWVFESSWKKYKGLTPYKDEKEMLSVYSRRLLDGWKKDMPSSKDVKIYKYDAGKSLVGLNCVEFMNKCKSNKPIYVGK